MPIPTYDKFIEPIMRFLASHPEGVPARDAHEAAAGALELTEAQRAERLPSGIQPVYKNRAGWAHDRLKRAGLSASPRRGFWQLTEKGLDFVRQHPKALTNADLDRLALENVHIPLRPKPTDAGALRDAAVLDSATPLLKPDTIASPDDRLEEAVSELRAAVADELLDTIGRSSPAFFETLVLDLLHAMGYGTSRDDLQRVGGSGDGGIDGIISLDRLGFEKVYVQAKRWQNQVGRPEIQGFYGALAGQRAKKGVFITTSTFSAPAQEFARSVEGIVLVDGARLADMMMEYGVGVTHRTIKIPKVDSDYFEE